MPRPATPGTEIVAAMVDRRSLFPPGRAAPPRNARAIGRGSSGAAGAPALGGALLGLGAQLEIGVGRGGLGRQPMCARSNRLRPTDSGVGGAAPPYRALAYAQLLLLLVRAAPSAGGCCAPTPRFRPRRHGGLRSPSRPPRHEGGRATEASDTAWAAVHRTAASAQVMARRPLVASLGHGAAARTRSGRRRSVSPRHRRTPPRHGDGRGRRGEGALPAASPRQAPAAT